MYLKKVATERNEDPMSVWWPTKNPMGKPWGLQPDGDLWKLVWEGLLTRGPRSITWQKVKGHAKEEHIARGEATQATKEGNDCADHYASRGIKQHDEAAVVTAKWLKKRQEDCTTLMGRV